MKNTKGIAVFLPWILLLVTSIAFAADSVKVGPWKNVNEKDGVVQYMRRNSLSSAEEYKAIGVVQAPVAVVESVLRDFTAWEQFNFMAKEIKPIEVPGLETLPDRKCLYFRQGLPWPVKDRDIVGIAHFSVTKPTGEVRCTVQKQDTDIIKNNGNIHMDLDNMCWILKPLEDGSTEVTYQNLVSPGGHIPAAPLNFLIKQIGLQTIIKLRGVVKQPQYQKNVTVVSQTPWPGHTPWSSQYQ